MRQRAEHCLNCDLFDSEIAVIGGAGRCASGPSIV